MGKMKSWWVLGLMSGTSLDGLDIIYTHIFIENGHYKFSIMACETIPYLKEWEFKLKNAFFESSENIEKLNIDYGVYLGEKVTEFRIKNTIKKIDFVASHGHTIFHKPNEGYTLQIGDGQTISTITGLKVVCDFRTQDVELGGQGAPLVPIGDQLLFSEYAYCLNLGGFANISNDVDGKRIAFDVCPVNIVMNHYSKKIGLNYDDGGKIAQSGIMNPDLLKALDGLEYYKKPIPKSLGFEYVNEIIFPLIDSYQLKVEDVLLTFVNHVVNQISNCLNQQKNDLLLVTGGGAFNVFLINELKKTVKNKIILPENNTINFKEALIFAFLGVLRTENQVNCLSSVTGAIKDHSSGKIFIKNG